MPKNAPCRCNRCGAEGRGFQICRCRVVAYCSRRCFELDTAPGDPGNHRAHCVARRGSRPRGQNSCTIQLSENDEAILLQTWDASVVTLPNGGEDAPPCSTFAVNIHVPMTGGLSDGVLFPTDHRKKKYLCGPSSLLRSRDYPGVEWFTSRIALQSGSSFVVVIPPRGAIAVTVSSKARRPTPPPPA